MRILLTGATGFVGQHIARALAARGHEVVGCSRRRYDALHRYPDFGWIRVDFAADRTPDAWRPRLTGFDVVINTAGIVRERPGESYEAVNFEAARALFQACAERGPRRVIQLSAPDCETDPRSYPTSKRFAERSLVKLDLDWTILRASLLRPDDLSSAIARLVEDGGPLRAVLELDETRSFALQPVPLGEKVSADVRRARDTAELHRPL